MDAAAPDLAIAGPGVYGTLLDENGAPLEGVAIAACTSKSCLYGRSAANGGFEIAVIDSGPTAVKSAEDDQHTPRRGVAIAPLIVQGSAVNAGTLYAPTLPAGANLGPTSSDPQTLLVGDGLTLTLARADLMPPLGAPMDNLAARSIPLAHAPPLPALQGETIVAIWALYPFGTRSGSPIAVRAPSSLPAGTMVNVRSLSDLDGTPSPPATAHSDGTFVATDPGQGVTELSWLIVSR